MDSTLRTRFKGTEAEAVVGESTRTTSASESASTWNRADMTRRQRQRERKDFRQKILNCSFNLIGNRSTK